MVHLVGFTIEMFHSVYPKARCLDTHTSGYDVIFYVFIYRLFNVVLFKLP